MTGRRRKLVATLFPGHGPPGRPGCGGWAKAWEGVSRRTGCCLAAGFAGVSTVAHRRRPERDDLARRGLSGGTAMIKLVGERPRHGTASAGAAGKLGGDVALLGAVGRAGATGSTCASAGREGELNQDGRRQESRHVPFFRPAVPEGCYFDIIDDAAPVSMLSTGLSRGLAGTGMRSSGLVRHKDGNHDMTEATPDARSFLPDAPPLKIAALDPEDLAILSAHLQDAQVRVGDMAYLPDSQRFVVVGARFDWYAATSGRCERCGTACTSSASRACGAPASTRIPTPS